PRHRGGRGERGPLARRQPVDRAVQRYRVDTTAGVLAERRQRGDAEAEPAVALGAAREQLGGAQRGVAEVAVDVAAVERAERAVAHDVAARDRARPLAVEALDHGRYGARRRAGVVSAAALEDAPPIV